jgi:mono/diheme cytochrome c family protein
MIRAAFFAVVLIASHAMAQATRTPPATKSGTPGTGSTKTGSTKTGSTKGPSTSAASKKAATPVRQKTTLSGVYTLEEATAGKDIYSSVCSSCHLTTNPHNGPEFRKKWAGKSLSDLFNYMRAAMPKNDPGSLADEDYGIVLAYMLRLNKMPPGKAYLSTDTLELRKIRFDTVRAVRKP